MYSDDKTLLEALKRGEVAAFEHIYKTHYDHLLNYADRLLQDFEAARDIVQEVYYKIWENREKLDITVSIQSYLFKSVYNHSVNTINHQKYVRQYEEKQIKELYFSTIVETPESEINLWQEDIEKALNEAIENLPEKCREVFKLSKIEGLKNREIAEKLKISEKTVERHMSIALSKLKDELSWLLQLLAFFHFPIGGKSILVCLYNVIRQTSMMNEKNTNIDDILTRLLGHEATDEEIVWFSTWILQEENKAYFMKFKKVWNLTNGRHATPEEIAAGLKKYRQFMLSSLRPRHYRRIIRHAAAAAAVILAGLFSIPLFMEEEPGVSPIPSPAAAPSKGVILTLADGSTVNVSQQDTFQMTTGEEAIIIRKRENKEIIYAVNDTLDDGSAAQKPEYNRIVVPAGMRFSVQLSDGTKVWLNAESSLRYPTRFGKGTRQVEIQGNVYFEVAKDSARPFIVSAPQLTTEVLGTAFEVNTYGDHDEMSVTLVEGSVKVHSPLRTAIISPNQQFIYDMNKQQTIVVLVNAAEKVKWKDGILSIKHELFRDIQEIV